MRERLLQSFDDRPAAVRARAVAKSFGAQVALDGLDLAVPEGSVYVLVGPNGAGKTTTLRTLLDLTSPDAGEVEVFGLSPSAHGPGVRAAIGYVADAHGFGYTDLGVDDLLAHHAAYFPAWDHAYERRLRLQLEIDGKRRFGELSKGQARRVQLVQALAHRPPLLLFDEPTDGLDPLAQERFQSLLADHLADNGTTVVISTHRVHEVEGLGDCLGVLKRGRLVAQLERPRLESRLHRVHFETAEGWSEHQDVGQVVVGRRDRGRERAWVLWGEPGELRAGLEGRGATVRHVESLNLEDATRALLAMEETS